MPTEENVQIDESRFWTTSQFRRVEGGELVIIRELEHEPERLNVHRFITTPAHARAGLSMTINLGNYESVKIDVGVTIPCYQEEIEDGIKAAFGIAERIIGEKSAEARAMAKSMSRKK